MTSVMDKKQHNSLNSIKTVLYGINGSFVTTSFALVQTEEHPLIQGTTSLNLRQRAKPLIIKQCSYLIG